MKSTKIKEVPFIIFILNSIQNCVLYISVEIRKSTYIYELKTKYSRVSARYFKSSLMKKTHLPIILWGIGGLAGGPGSGISS